MTALVERVRTWLPPARRDRAMTADAAARAARSGSPWYALLPYMRPHRGRLALGLTLLLGNVAMDLLRPWPLKFIFDVVLLQSPQAMPVAGALVQPLGAAGQLGVASASILAIAILAGLCEYGAQLRFALAGQRAISAIKHDLFAHIQRLSLAFHRRSKSGELLTRLVKDVAEIKSALAETAIESLSEALLLACMVAFLVTMDPMLALLAALIFPPLVWCVSHYATGIRQATRRQREKESRTASIFSEALAAIGVVQSFGRESQTTARFESENQKTLQADLAATRLKGRLNRWVEVIVAAGTCVVLWYGATQVIAGRLTPGDLIVFSAYLKAMYKPIRRIASNVLQLSRATVGAARVVEILRTEPEVQDRPGAVAAPRFAGRIEFDRVSFGYDAAAPILQDVSFTAPAGSLVAIVGRSGAGKSTLASLVPRLYDPMAGSVRVDGRDIRDYTIATLRDRISVVAQESVLFGTSIRENIAFGVAAPDPEAVRAAAGAAGAHEFIRRLKRGYDTIVGERGATLSGGERQRIAIARAFYKDAPILILDEPTSGLDSHAEAHLLASIDRLTRGRTTIVIAHRIATVVRADLIVLVEDGTVRAAGTHRALLETQPSYRALVELQTWVA